MIDYNHDYNYYYESNNYHDDYNSAWFSLVVRC